MKKCCAGETYERTVGYYAEREFFASRTRATSFNICEEEPSNVEVKGSIALGRDQSSNGKALASSRQECRWRARAEAGCGIICGSDSVDVVEGFPCQTNGRIPGRECSGENFHCQT